MPTIRKRGNRYHVQIRRRGQSITRTFDRLATAKSWIPKIEGVLNGTFRHEATSRLFEKGLNPVEVATITGRKDTRMLMRYTHLRAKDLVGLLMLCMTLYCLVC